MEPRLLTLSQALRLSKNPCVAFVGAGGKTSAMFRVAQELAPALVTTSTHIGAWQASKASRHFIWPENEPMPDMEAVLGDGISLVTGPLNAEQRRCTNLTPAQLELLKQIAGYHGMPLLIEADGSRQKPLKAPAAHEPAIPGFVDIVVVAAGLRALQKPLTEQYVHRPEIFSRLSGLELGEPISALALARVLIHAQGGNKNIPPAARRVVLLNQADTPELQAQANEMEELLLTVFDSVIVSVLDATQGAHDLQPHTDRGISPPHTDRGLPRGKSNPVIAVKENIGAVLLAAGEASRYGQPKQLLDYHGQPFVRVAAESALKAGLSPVIVVCGAYDLPPHKNRGLPRPHKDRGLPRPHKDRGLPRGKSQPVSQALDGLQFAGQIVTIVHNPDWQSGQSSSVKAGIRQLPEKTGGAIFMLADQPQVRVELLRALVERHSQELPAILAPMVFDQRANPVLFDRVTFADLLTLSGDTGGRALFSKFSPRYLNWYDRRLLLDVDTPEDYARLMDGEA